MGVTNSNKVISTDRIDCDGSLKVTLALTAAPDIVSNPTDIVLTLDRSGSMTGTPLANMKEGAKTFIDIIEEATDGIQDGQIGSGSRIGIVSFAETATVDAPLITSVDDLKDAVDGLTAGGSTNHADAFTKATELLTPPSGNARVMVMFTDGMQRNLSFNFSGKRYDVGGSAEVPGQSAQPSTGLGGSFTPYSGRDSMKVAFQWLLTAQDAKVLSSPNILLSRNEVSRIVTGEEIPIQEANSTGNTLSLSTKFKSVGVTLEVEPSMINRDNVTLRIFPKVSNVVRYENVSAGGDTTYPVPVISARSVETHLRMQDKQVVMMGGLYNSRDTLQQQRIPVLSDLPLIGELFTGKNESKEVTQLIFFLKIHIISPDQAASGVFYNFDRSGKISEKLGEIVENADSIPLHRTSVENFGEELNHAKPGELERRRRKFHETPISIDEPAETTSGAETK